MSTSPRTAPSLLDPYELEHRVVKLRNTLYFLISPKDHRDARKIFVAGHPRTGTGSFHRVFTDNGLRSLHSPGSWPTRHYDCFSDRGNYQPLALLDRYYREARFILNTRTAERYIRSRMNQTGKSQEKRWGRRARFTVANIENEILRRNRHYLQFIRHFSGRDNFVVVNIERPGAFGEVCEWLGLQYADQSWNRNARQVLSDEEHANIDRAFAALGIGEQRRSPFVIPALLAPAERREYEAFMARHPDRILL